MAKELTKRQRYWLEHIRRASESGKTLKAYARARRVSLGALYNAKSKLMKNGVLPRQESSAEMSTLVPVRIEPAATARTACRSQHPSGWLLECDRWPEPEWLLALVQGSGGDASP